MQALPFLVFSVLLGASATGEEARSADDDTPDVVEKVTSPLIDEGRDGDRQERKATPRAGAKTLSTPDDAATKSSEAKVDGKKQDEGSARLRILVLEPKALSGTSNDARLLGSILAVELGAIESLEITTTEDLKQMMALEAQRQTLGCDDTSCLAEIAGAMGANLVVYGELGRLGETYVLTLHLFDSATARAAGRTTLRGASTDQLAGGLRPAIAKLLGPTLAQRQLPLPANYIEGSASVVLPREPSPPPTQKQSIIAEDADAPSWVMPIGLLAGGGTVLILSTVGGGLGAFVGYQLAAAAAATSMSANLSQKEFDDAALQYGLGSVLFYGALTAAGIGTLIALIATASGAAFSVSNVLQGDE